MMVYGPQLDSSNLGTHMDKLPTLEVRFSHEDIGTFRNYYKPVNKKDKRLFCNQPSIGWSLHWYICSSDGEPSHEYTKERIVPID